MCFLVCLAAAEPFDVDSHAIVNSFDYAGRVGLDNSEAQLLLRIRGVFDLQNVRCPDRFKRKRICLPVRLGASARRGQLDESSQRQRNGAGAKAAEWSLPQIQPRNSPKLRPARQAFDPAPG